jgi:hypothetical protein
VARRAEPRKEGRLLSPWRTALRETLPLAAVALAVTLVRLAGERLGWSAAWFSRETGGVVPSRLGWVVGITWLALPFGIWLALRLVGRGAPPASARRALGFALVGAIAFFALLRFVPRLGLGFPGVLLPIWAAAVAGAALAWYGWPALGRLLFVYGLLSRVPVVVVMFLALRGHWGTHYDYVDAPAVRQLALGPAFFWLALVPQLVFWVGFTVIAGALTGAAAALVARAPAAARGTLPAARTAARGGV